MTVPTPDPSRKGTTPPPPTRKRKTYDTADDAPPIVNDDTWTKGDFALVSSDNVRFRVDLVHLLSASSVFRDMASVASAGGNRELHLTDDTMESSNVIKRFLFLLIDAEVDVEDLPGNFYHLVYLAQLVVKYDCRFLKTVLGFRIKDTINNGTPGVYTWVIGAIMDNTDLCMAAMYKPNQLWPLSAVPIDAMRTLPKVHCFNPHSFSYQWWSFIPQPYLWALSRAWVLTGGLTAFAATFRDMLAEAKGNC
ncbi:hypothetical protein Q8F55_002745 [Vanrija albida]|uniref:BTB domain-containing protein n=1 Tax=Vanrija albida TaxID=181172 RepID=A0ABR3QAR0_9TREE